MSEGFHEIQLTAKQLVFLFMAVTVVAVVVFLCGVLVGRGVRLAQDQRAAAALAPAREQAPESLPRSAPAPGSAPEELSYHRRLEGTTPPGEELKSPHAVAASPAGEPPGTEPAPTAAALVPRGEGFTVQVAALREEREAQAVAARLVAKGYPAYVLGPPPGAPAAVYRVRVGKYPDRRQAEGVLRRLEQEEQFRPWITR